MSLKLLGRKINNLFARGKLLELDPETKVPTAKVGLMADEIFEGIEYPQDFGLKSRPPKGCEVMTGHFGGNRNHGTILKMFDRDLMPENLEEGETVIYNGFQARVILDKDSNIIITNDALTIEFNNDGAVTITSTGTVTIDAPILAVTGDMLVDGTINGVDIV